MFMKFINQYEIHVTFPCTFMWLYMRIFKQYTTNVKHAFTHLHIYSNCTFLYVNIDDTVANHNMCLHISFACIITLLLTVETIRRSFLSTHWKHFLLSILFDRKLKSSSLSSSLTTTSLYYHHSNHHLRHQDLFVFTIIILLSCDHQYQRGLHDINIRAKFQNSKTWHEYSGYYTIKYNGYCAMIVMWL